jgi:hypothetical protein
LPSSECLSVGLHVRARAEPRPSDDHVDGALAGVHHSLNQGCADPFGGHTLSGPRVERRNAGSPDGARATNLVPSRSSRRRGLSAMATATTRRTGCRKVTTRLFFPVRAGQTSLHTMSGAEPMRHTVTPGERDRRTTGELRMADSGNLRGTEWTCCARPTVASGRRCVAWRATVMRGTGDARVRGGGSA